MKATERDISKLPAWAQEMIKQAQRERDEARQTLEQIYSADASNTQWDEMIGPAHNLPNDAYIVFTVNGNRVGVKVKGDVLDVNTNGGSVAVLPRASNAIQIKVLGR